MRALFNRLVFDINEQPTSTLSISSIGVSNSRVKDSDQTLLLEIGSTSNEETYLISFAARATSIKAAATCTFKSGGFGPMSTQSTPCLHRWPALASNRRGQHRVGDTEAYVYREPTNRSPCANAVKA